MYKSCKIGQFPSVENVCCYGMSGYNGTNPIHILDCYTRAIKDGITEKDFEKAMKTDTLNELVMQSPTVQKSPYFLEIMKQGGIQVAPKQSFECQTCGFYSNTRMCAC